MKIRIFLFIGICLIITSFFSVADAAQDNFPYCLVLQPYGPSHDLGACRSKEDKQRFLGKKIEDVWVSFDTTTGTGEIRLLNSHKEALQEYDKVIAEKRNYFQRGFTGKHDRIDTQDLSVGSKSILLSFMRTTGFFGVGGVSMKDSNTEGLGWTLVPEISITAFVQDKCLVYFGGGVSLLGYGNNYVDYHKVDKHGRSAEYWQIINTHPNFDHGKQYLIDQSTELAKVFSKNIKEKCSKAGQKKNTQSLSNGQQPRNISKYTQALVVETPQESDFKKVKPSDFKIIYPQSTSSATTKPATGSADITGSIFIGKVGGDGQILIDIPDGETATLSGDLTAFDGEISGWKFIRNFNQSSKPDPFQARVVMRDCHLDIRPVNETRWASDWSMDRIISTGNCDYSIGGDSTRILVDRGEVNFKTQSGVDITVEKADFGIGYDTKSGTSVVEAYNGSVKVSNKSGQVKTISSVYGSEINQIEVVKDGTMTEKTAIPQSGWEAFLASNQKKNQEVNAKSSLPVIPAILVLGIGGLIFFLYRTGRLIPFYKTFIQRAFELMKKIRFFDS